MKSAFITGGAGFFGGILKRRLLEQGISCVSIDLEPDVDIHPLLTSIQGDIRDISLLEKTCSNKQFDAVFHCAAILAHVAKDNQFLWTSNVDGTRNVADLAKKHVISKFVFISSNCLWGQGFDRSVTEDDKPDPIEIYGKSKWEGEKILHEYQDVLDITISENSGNRPEMYILTTE